MQPNMTRAPVDPDPTPTATPWVEYLAAAQSLDAVRRDAATAAAAATHAASVTRAELAQLATQLELQRARLTGESARAGSAAPQLAPTPAERAAADAAIAGDPAAVPEALLRCQQLLESANAELAQAAPEERGWWPPPVWVWTVAGLAAVIALAAAIPLVLLLLR
jgi:hypothetical protein